MVWRAGHPLTGTSLWLFTSTPSDRFFFLSLFIFFLVTSPNKLPVFCDCFLLNRLISPCSSSLDTMASSGLQLFGFLLALVGLGATVAATFMVEWKKQTQGNTYHIYEGLWETCSSNEKTICESYESLFKLASKFFFFFLSHLFLSPLKHQTLPVEIPSTDIKLL